MVDRGRSTVFEVLSEKLQAVFRKLNSKGRLTEQDVDQALREVRLALLEADVNFRVVRDFLARVRERAIGTDVLQSLTPGQQIVKIVNEELIAVLGGGESRLALASHPPTVVMLVGLQGSGKTTTAAKWALQQRALGQRPLLVAADVYRPAAVEQLNILGKQLNIPVFSNSPEDPITICQQAVQRAQETASTLVILDTAGRLHIDQEMMAELVRIKTALCPTEVLLVADAMTGQDAVRAAEDFHRQVGLTGLILTKMDGDARGGAALSIRAVTGVPIKFIGVGEKLNELEPFHADRLASRILGMGDILTLIERAQEAFDQRKAKELEKKFRQASFDLEDFLEQMQQVKRMGSVSQILEMIPGFNTLRGRLPTENLDDRQLKKVEAIILSMTPEERHHPEIIGGSRRRRIARGSGTTPQDINQLLNQFHQTQKLMKELASGRTPRFLGRMFR